MNNKERDITSWLLDLGKEHKDAIRNIVVAIGKRKDIDPIGFFGIYLYFLSKKVKTKDLKIKEFAEFIINLDKEDQAKIEEPPPLEKSYKSFPIPQAKTNE